MASEFGGAPGGVSDRTTENRDGGGKRTVLGREARGNGRMALNKKPQANLVFAGETEAEAAARRDAGGAGQRPEEFAGAATAPADPAGVTAQQGGRATTVNVGVNIPRRGFVGERRSRQSGLTIPSF